MGKKARHRSVRKLEQVPRTQSKLGTSESLPVSQPLPLASMNQPKQELTPNEVVLKYRQIACKYIPAELIQEGVNFCWEFQNSDLPESLDVPADWPRDLKEVLWNPSTKDWLLNEAERICTTPYKVRQLLAHIGILPDSNSIEGQVLTVLAKALALAIMAEPWPDDEQ